MAGSVAQDLDRAQMEEEKKEIAIGLNSKIGKYLSKDHYSNGLDNLVEPVKMSEIQSVMGS